MRARPGRRIVKGHYQYEAFQGPPLFFWQLNDEAKTPEERDRRLEELIAAGVVRRIWLKGGKVKAPRAVDVSRVCVKDKGGRLPCPCRACAPELHK